MDQNLRSPGGLILTHTHFKGFLLAPGAREYRQVQDLLSRWPLQTQQAMPTLCSEAVSAKGDHREKVKGTS